MSTSSDLFTALTGDTTVGAIVGKKVFPSTIPQGKTPPAVVYNVISRVPENILSGLGIYRTRVQIDAYESTYDKASTLGDAIVAAIDSRMTGAVVIRHDGPTIETETGLFRMTTEISTIRSTT